MHMHVYIAIATVTSTFATYIIRFQDVQERPKIYAIN